MLDAVSGSAESCSTSEQCVEEHNQQQYRVGFEQEKLGELFPVWRVFGDSL
jgi:hypothetical protein